MYIGPGFSFSRSDGYYLALFQVAAKLLEITCVASLTTVVLQVLRHDLQKDGVPFGLVGSGLFFSQANYLWSPEVFVGAMQSVKSWRRLRLVMFIIAAGFLAVVIAPSTAVLLQHRVQRIPAGGTEYYVPLTPDQLWPSNIDGSEELPMCFDGTGTRNIICANGGFESLSNYFKNWNATMGNLPLTLWNKFGVSSFVVQSPSDKIPRLVNDGMVGGYSGNETIRSQPNAISASLSDSLIFDWYMLSLAQHRNHFSSAHQYVYAVQRLSSVRTTNPIVHIKCAAPQNLSSNQYHVDFHPKKWYTSDSRSSIHWYDQVKPMMVPELYQTVSNRLQVQWVALPVKDFGAVSGGVILQYPWELNTKTRTVVGCAVSASWFEADIVSDSTANGAAWSIPDGFAAKFGYAPYPTIINNLNASSASARKSHRLITIIKIDIICPNTIERLFFDTGLTNALIEQRTEPQFVFVESSQPCVFMRPDKYRSDTEILNDFTCGGGGKHQLMEHIIGSTIADGLSRYGSRYIFKQDDLVLGNSPLQWTSKRSLKGPTYSASLLSSRPRKNAVLAAPEGSGYVTLRLRIEVVGYAWYATSVTDYLAIGVVIAYIVIVLSHTVWTVCYTGVTSSSWDTVTELVGLALQSPVPEPSIGIGAGIERFSTYRLMVKLRAFKESGTNVTGTGGYEQLILALDHGKGSASSSVSQGNSQCTKYRKVIPERRYL
ncbi:MAG: hypothetical protein Q9213_002793 [Squamulea squamosa]